MIDFKQKTATDILVLQQKLGALMSELKQLEEGGGAKIEKREPKLNEESSGERGVAHSQSSHMSHFDSASYSQNNRRESFKSQRTLNKDSGTT
jgi:hypothetical protein